MDNHLKKKDIENLTSKFWYSHFEDGEDGCNDVYSFSEIRDDLKQRYNFHQNIYDKIVRALCFIYNRKKKHRDNFDEDLCSYLYYWLGEKIFPIVHDKTVFSKIIKMIYDELSRTIMFRTCTPLHKNIDANSFNVYKMLFDYSSDDYHINLNTVSPNTKCDKHYIETINKYINTYNDVYFSCYVNKEQKYNCDYFHKLFKKDQYTKLPSFYCKTYDEQTFSTEALSRIETRQHALVQSPNSKGNTDFVGKSYLQENSDQHRSHLEHHNHAFTVQRVSDTGAPILTDDNTEGSSSKTIAGSIVPVLGVSSFSLLLYKVTPVGEYINRLLGRNRNMYNPMEYIDGFNPYSDGMIPGDRTMNISYHRL
ncbi:PIR protein [Plasmodium vivax]|nr:PIR protein [Plasmodium vivax]